MPSRSANSRSDRARPAASSSNHARPRAIALISVGSHRERSFGIATVGSTSLISTPRRLETTAAVSSIGLSPGFSAGDDETAPPKSERRRTMIVICVLLDHDFLDEFANDLGSFRWGALEGPGKAGCTIEHFPGL